MVSKYTTGLTELLLQGLSKPNSYGDLVYKFRNEVGNPELSNRFSKITYVINETGIALKQSACLAVDPITTDHFAYLFYRTPKGRDFKAVLLSWFICVIVRL